jgi:hypothetical protein
VTVDRIVLTIPRDEGYENVAQLVLAGVAARLDFTYEVVDDLGTALETLLDWRAEDGDLTVELEVGQGTVKVVDHFAAVEREGGGWIELEKRVPSVQSSK